MLRAPSGGKMLDCLLPPAHLLIAALREGARLALAVTSTASLTEAVENLLPPPCFRRIKQRMVRLGTKAGWGVLRNPDLFCGSPSLAIRKTDSFHWYEPNAGLAKAAKGEESVDRRRNNRDVDAGARRGWAAKGGARATDDEDGGGAAAGRGSTAWKSPRRPPFMQTTRGCKASSNAFIRAPFRIAREATVPGASAGVSQLPE